MGWEIQDGYNFDSKYNDATTFDCDLLLEKDPTDD